VGSRLEGRLSLLDPLVVDRGDRLAVSGEGVADLRARLEGKITVLLGQSGVGKSSLVNANG